MMSIMELHSSETIKMETGFSKIHGDKLGEKEDISEWLMVIHVVSASMEEWQ